MIPEIVERYFEGALKGRKERRICPGTGFSACPVHLPCRFNQSLKKVVAYLQRFDSINKLMLQKIDKSAFVNLLWMLSELLPEEMEQ